MFSCFFRGSSFSRSSFSRGSSFSRSSFSRGSSFSRSSFSRGSSVSRSLVFGLRSSFSRHPVNEAKLVISGARGILKSTLLHVPTGLSQPQTQRS